jgi:hypothetical protein
VRFDLGADFFLAARFAEERGRFFVAICRGYCNRKFVMCRCPRKTIAADWWE